MYDKTYPLLILPDQNVLIVNDHVLEEIFRAGHVLHRGQISLVRLFFLLDSLLFHALSTQHG